MANTTPRDHRPGLRAVLGQLVLEIEELGIPDPRERGYDAWLDRWVDRVLRTTDYYKQRAAEEARPVKETP